MAHGRLVPSHSGRQRSHQHHAPLMTIHTLVQSLSVQSLRYPSQQQALHLVRKPGSLWVRARIHMKTCAYLSSDALSWEELSGRALVKPVRHTHKRKLTHVLVYWDYETRILWYKCQNLSRWPGDIHVQSQHLRSRSKKMSWRLVRHGGPYLKSSLEVEGSESLSLSSRPASYLMRPSQNSAV